MALISRARRFWVYDTMVTNKEECVTGKSPSNNILIENIYCNWSGGCAIGSLGADTTISNILYRNVYTWSSNLMMMIKPNSGSGHLKNVLFENFIGHENAYSLDIDQYWSSMSAVDGAGIKLGNVTFDARSPGLDFISLMLTTTTTTQNWKGTCANSLQYDPVKVICADGSPCSGVTISDFAMWTEKESKGWYSCRSAYGSGGFCLRDGSQSTPSYAVSATIVLNHPRDIPLHRTMEGDLETAFGYTLSIPIPTIPTSFSHFATLVSKLAGS